MKSQSLQSITILTAILAICAVSPWKTAQAQSASADSSATEQREPTVEFPPEVKKHKLEEVEFDRAFTSVVGYLRNEFTPINFVVRQDPDTERIIGTVGIRLKLRSVGLRDILNAITYSTNGKLQWEQLGPTMVGFHVKTQPESKDSQSQPPKEAEIQTKVFNLPYRLQTTDQTTIEKALYQLDQVGAMIDKLNKGVKKPRLQYHNGSGSLVVTGTTDSIDLVNSIIENLQKSIAMQAGAFTKNGEEKKSPSPESEVQDRERASKSEPESVDSSARSERRQTTDADREHEEQPNLRLMSVDSKAQIPDQGRFLVIVAQIGNKLHVRVFSDDGDRLVDIAEGELSPDQRNELKELLEPYWQNQDLLEEHEQELLRRMEPIFQDYL